MSKQDDHRWLKRVLEASAEAAPPMPFERGHRPASRARPRRIPAAAVAVPARLVARAMAQADRAPVATAAQLAM
ncbi:MAG: hypothetical protein KJZ85_02490 [Rhodobacteraceae bacterium]|jgi:hypothetical protein|nr:hypothetical protein [Paracoccaceae bacterium]